MLWFHTGIMSGTISIGRVQWPLETVRFSWSSSRSSCRIRTEWSDISIVKVVTTTTRDLGNKMGQEEEMWRGYHTHRGDSSNEVSCLITVQWKLFPQLQNKRLLIGSDWQHSSSQNSWGGVKQQAEERRRRNCALVTTEWYVYKHQVLQECILFNFTILS